MANTSPRTQDQELEDIRAKLALERAESDRLACENTAMTIATNRANAEQQTAHDQERRDVERRNAIDARERRAQMDGSTSPARVSPHHPKPVPEVTDARGDESIRFLFEDGRNTVQPHADKPHQFDMKKGVADSSICFGNFDVDHPETKGADAFAHLVRSFSPISSSSPAQASCRFIHSPSSPRAPFGHNPLQGMGEAEPSRAWSGQWQCSRSARHDRNPPRYTDAPRQASVCVLGSGTGSESGHVPSVVLPSPAAQSVNIPLL
ncbi:hypothetical protein CC79DRAFT_1316027 [Sarocladium strictum]